MREQIVRELSASLSDDGAKDLLNSYEAILDKFYASDTEAMLNRAGKFVENTLRCIQFVRTKKLPVEIKSVAQTVQEISKDGSIPEPLRILIPRIATAMIYDVRSKKGAVHVKGIDPGQMDANLTLTSCSWIISEFLRLFHTGDDNHIERYIAAIMRSRLPLIETIANETTVTRKVPTVREIALLLSTNPEEGMSRNAIGKLASCSPASVTKSLGKLTSERHAHRVESGNYFLTGTGEAELATWLSSQRF